MDYAELFLERAAGLKYQLYIVLVQAQGQDVTINDLALRLATKYQSVYSLFQEVLEDVVKLTGQPYEQVRRALLKGACLPLSLDAYRSFLVQGSVLYRLLDYALTAASPSLGQFCEQMFVSHSTVRRKLRGLNDFLAAYHLRFRLHRFDFEGNEFNIRYFLYTVYWWAHRGASWAFSQVAQPRLESELIALTIAPDQRPLERRQALVFWAITHLRVGKHHPLLPTPYLTHLEQQITAFDLRKAPVPIPFTWRDATALNFFQLSLPRFDARGRTPESVAQEAALLMDDATQMVVDTLSATIYQPALGDFDDDLYLNLLRLCGGMRLAGGAFIQVQDLFGGGINLALGDSEVLITKVVKHCQDTATFAPIAPDVAFFARVVARLVAPYRLAANTERCLHIDLAVDPEFGGYRELLGLVTAVPWVAQLGPARDWTIGCRDLPNHEVNAQFIWYADALALPVYCESLIQALLFARRHKQAGQTKREASVQ